MSKREPLKAPFPWFGGKARARELIWERFGDVPNYVEPFAGSLAVLLGRPHEPRVETVNDLDCFLANFWRCLSGMTAPDATAGQRAAVVEAVAYHADGPVNEADLHARHRWLVNQVEFRERVRSDPHYFDAKVAGWWVWGLCAWIGSGWCRLGVESVIQLPMLSGGSGGKPAKRAGQGVHGMAMRGPSPQLPSLGGNNPGDGTLLHGVGVHAKGMRGPVQKIPLLGGTKGTGVHRRGLREPAEQLPYLGGAGDGGPQVGQGVHAKTTRSRILDVFTELAERLRYTRVACGDFERVLSDSVTWRHGTTAILLDPEYPEGADVYAEGSPREGNEHVWFRAARWAAEHGEDARLRIALCGYAGTWTPPAGWAEVAWKAKGGYGGQRKDGTNENADRERVWFSPGCLVATPAQGSLFG